MIRNMLHGPWKEASSPVVTLKVDDKNVNAEAIAMALAYLYGHHPKLNDINAFRVLAAASFLDLQVIITKTKCFFFIIIYMSDGCSGVFSDFGFGVVQDLCAICTDFIISELWTSNFLAYQVRILLLFGLVVVRCVCGFLFIFLGFLRCLRRVKIMEYTGNV